jgi:tagatose 6-phosphate kinase
VLLVVCPNLSIDRILQVENFQATKVQRSRSALCQPGGKGSNVARVFRQLGGEVVLVGFVGSLNASQVIEPLRQLGVHVDTVRAYEGESRTCTIVCDSDPGCHPTVINEESPQIESHAGAKLLAKVGHWIHRADAVLTTGSLSTGLCEDFYARILTNARSMGKLTAIDATGSVLRLGLQAQPTFMKPNTEEFLHLTKSGNAPAFFALPPHAAVTFGKAGAVVIHAGKCVCAVPPRVSALNPIGAGDAFTAAYLKSLLERRPAFDCLRLAIAAAASDATTLRPGFVDSTQVQSFVSQVELRAL